jgi:hypothetical protein
MTRAPCQEASTGIDLQALRGHFLLITYVAFDDIPFDFSQDVAYSYTMKQISYTKVG